MSGEKIVTHYNIDRERFEAEFEIAPNQEGHEDAIEPAPTEQDFGIFHQQLCLAKRRIFFAVRAKGMKPKQLAGLLRHTSGMAYTARDINRVCEQFQRDLAYAQSTGRQRDQEILRALKTCIPDDAHQRVLYLNLTRGMSTRQLAEGYGVRHMTVHKWLKQGRKRLTAYLRQKNRLDLLETIRT